MFEPDHHYVACFDPGTRSVIATLAIATTRNRLGARPLRDVVVARQWLGGGLLALEEAAELCRSYAVTTAAANEHIPKAIREQTLLALGLTLSHRETSEQDYRDMYESLRLKISLDEVRLPKDPYIRQDLLSLFRHMTAQGKASIHVPTAKSGRHAEFAPTIARVVALPCPAPHEARPKLTMAERFERQERKELEAAERKLESRYSRLGSSNKREAWSPLHFSGRVGR